MALVDGLEPLGQQHKNRFPYYIYYIKFSA